jgi:hypothetical protein
MEVSTEVITPESARQLLKLNTRNRPMNSAAVDRLAEEMVSGRWKFNGDTICLNGDRLIDGQHRLAAVAKSGVSITTLVVRGLTSDVFDTKDIGRRRTAGDVLAIMGEKSVNTLAGGLILVDAYDRGVVMSTTQKARANQIEPLLQKYPDMRRSARLASDRRTLLTPAVSAAAHFITSRIEPVIADAMYEDFRTGVGLEAKDPVLLLRNRMVENRASKGKLARQYMLALYIKAWNARRAGESRTNLRWRQTGPTAESFPVAI